jgi:uncharacterized protein YkwD
MAFLSVIMMITIRVSKPGVLFLIAALAVSIFSYEPVLTLSGDLTVPTVPDISFSSATPLQNNGENLYLDEEEITILEQYVFQFLNMERVNNGLPPLIWDDQLAEAARMHSTDMAERDYLSHYSPEGEGVENRLNKVGYRFSVAGENIFEATYLENREPSELAKIIITGWMESKGHRFNILNGAYQECGVGIVYDQDTHRIIVTAVFASPF